MRALKITAPGAAAEKLFIQSFDTVVVNCSAAMSRLGNTAPGLVNIDYDTGNETAPGEYKLADITYGKLVLQLNGSDTGRIDESLRQNILAFYANPDANIYAKKNNKEWEAIVRALEQMRIPKNP